MTIAFHLDAEDLDSIPFNHERASQVAIQALLAHANLVAKYRGMQSPDVPMLPGQDDTVAMLTEPIEL